MSALTYCQNRYETPEEDVSGRGSFAELFLRTPGRWCRSPQAWIATLPREVVDLDSLVDWFNGQGLVLTDDDGELIDDVRAALAEEVLTGGGMSRYIGGVTFGEEDGGTLLVEAILLNVRRNEGGHYRS